MSTARDRARQEENDANKELNNMLDRLEMKRDEFLARVKLARSDKSNDAEVTGGRTISRYSDIRVATNAGIDSQIMTAISDFFSAAQGGDKGKKAAISGAKNLVMAGINAVFGAGTGQGREKEGFVVLYMNFAFVRIDYMVYAYTSSGKSWGAEASKAGACYVCDLAVVDINAFKIHLKLIDYLLTQAFNRSGDEFKLRSCS